MKRNSATYIISLLFIILFVYAAASKLMDYQKFKVQLGKSPIFTSYAGIAAIVVPLVEIIIALLLTIDKFRLAALYASFSLMVMFTAYIIIILRFSDFVPCSCGGVLQDLSWGQHLIFNVIFVVLGVAAVLLFPANKVKTAVP